MTTRPGPAWLKAFQRSVSACLTEPLDDASGTWRARPARYPASLRELAVSGPGLDADARLAVYNRQYWFRLSGALQGDYPLVCRLLGAWAFNQRARDYLLAHPPSGHDLQQVGSRFGSFLLAPGRAVGLPRRALAQAVAIDEAIRRALLAPAERPLAPGAAPRDAPLQRSGGWTLLTEDWPLVELRARPLEDERAQALPPRRLEAQGWAIGGHGGAVAFLQLEPLQALLLERCSTWPLEEALGALEAACPAGQRAGLPARVQGWLAQALSLGFWVERL
jgi:hypothetical protein